MSTNAKFLNHFGKWHGNSGFVIFMTPPSNKDIVAQFASHDCPCFIKECDARNISCLSNGTAEIWWKDTIAGPFFCDVEEIFPTMAAAQARLSKLAQSHIAFLQAKIDGLLVAQQNLHAYVKTDVRTEDAS